MTESLTEGLVALLARPISQGDRRRAALHLVDWIGCAVAGAASEAGAVFRRHAEGASGPARILLGGTASARDATFANGAFGNVLEMDDVHREAILHPGPVVMPAALALAAERDAPGHALLDAILRGYEAEIRIGRAMGPSHYARFHPTATIGPFGAAAACASLLGLDATRSVWTLGNAGTQAGGVWQCRHEKVMTKQLHTARAAAMGLEAATLAALGLTGPRLILEGPQGVFAGLAPDARPHRVLADPGAPWLVHETSFKPWPACRHAHPAIDAALALRPRIEGRAIAAVRVESYADALAFCDRAAPSDTIGAKFSLQHAVAVALLDGPPPLSAFDPPALARPDLAALRAKVTVAEDAAFTRAYPAHFGAAVTVTLTDGAVLREAVPDALGDPENPLSEDAILTKARMLMESAGVARPDAVIAAALALAEGAPASHLNAALP
ncbi:MmgE/PrpD family protein [Falsiroseomonas oryziterrae]|uniref:MmgE/PrpD family protein n=1 Tax=Falsiroseomonas oryziterrae TaxID=2911368 RepID=UPI001F21C441|nr:MmgE/PrpD family protein [Roseomonas sp. NPKOSM-4]